MSTCTKAKSAAITIVMPPMRAIGFMLLCPMLKPSQNTGYRRAPRKMPATTMVEECKSDDTGVGPAMASGNQVCNGNWPDLPMMATSSAIEAMSSTRCDD